MKLWQKIFLLTLTLVIILVNTTSLVLLKNNHDLTLVREQQTALTRHSYLSTEILNSVVNAQLAERTVPLADGRMQTLLRDVLNSQSDNLSGASIYQGELLIHTSNDPAYPTGDQGVIDSAAQQAELNLLAAPDFSSTITRLDNQVYLMLVSRPTFNEQTYQLITFYNITSTYQLFDASFNQVRIIGVVSALLIGGILLLLVLTLLRPLRSLSTATRQIASGDLQKRVKVRG
ncbi:MAG: HAMP domain-containing protein, partial [Actinomycetia bacterium]|nr:HAMP domain-containing protein [Actinomycetes bacterium]